MTAIAFLLDAVDGARPLAATELCWVGGPLVHPAEAHFYMRLLRHECEQKNNLAQMAAGFHQQNAKSSKKITSKI